MRNSGIWAQGARAGDPDPFFFSTLYTKTCARTRSAETADATYGRLTRSRAGRRRTQEYSQACGARRRARSRAGIGARQQPLWVTHTHQAGRRRWQGARRVETRWRGAARGDNRAIVASPSYSRTPSHIALQCAHASCCYRARRGGVGDAGGIKPACTDAPERAPPWGTQRRTRHTSHYDGVEHKRWLPSPPPPPPPPPPWASRRRPRHHIRR
jgi:hypothetical protein